MAQGLPPIGAEVPDVSGLPPIGAEVTPTFRSSNAKDASGNAEVDPNTLGTALRHFGQQVNPVTMVKGINSMVPIPKVLGGGGMDAPGNIVRFAQHSFFPTEILLKSKEALAKGDYPTAARHFINYVLPVVGPMVEEAGDEMQQGKYAAGLGDAIGVGTALFGPEAFAKMVGSVKTGPLLKNPNAAERAAVTFGQKEGIPVDAATATGNRFVRGVQKLSDESLLGSGPGQRARAAQDAALDTTGHRLANDAFPRAVTQEGAGTSMGDALTRKMEAHESYATTAYDRLRDLEKAGALPPVSLKAAKLQLKGIYDQLMRAKDIAPPMGAKGRALVALDRLMTAPDTAPVSIVDAALGDLKALEREASGPGQGVVRQAIKNVDAAVQASVFGGGPDAVRALKDGRAATVAKYQTAEVLDRIRQEPVGAYRQMTAPKDAGIDLLRTVQRETPQALPEIARAYLDDLLNTATAEGGFKRTDKLFADWQKLGGATKQALFPKAGQIAALDNFFLLAKRIGENPNPSGSALTAAKFTEGGLVFLHPTTGVPLALSGAVLSKLLHSPAFVQALTRGLNLTRGRVSPAVYATAIGRIVQAANEAGTPIPATADQGPPR